MYISVMAVMLMAAGIPTQIVFERPDPEIQL